MLYDSYYFTRIKNNRKGVSEASLTFGRYQVVGNDAERTGIQVLGPDRYDRALVVGTPHHGHIILGGQEHGPVVIDVLHVHFYHGARA